MKPCKKLIFGFFALVMSQAALAAPQLLDRVAVQINDGIVLESEVQNMVDTVKANAKAPARVCLRIRRCALRLLSV